MAIVDPISVPNNKMGVHILFPSELDNASQLINSNNGQWGYVTIPIQAGDKDMEKWQSFMDNCQQKKVIPLVRLLTEGDYPNTKNWRIPKEVDILDFANFLNSLNWPTKNRYIIVFNEVNRGDEWGGIPNPKEYAEILQYSVTVFKSKNPDFFIITSGMDNAAATGYNASINQYQYFRQMENAVPGIFNQVDGLSSHSYPNPGFSQPPTSSGLIGIHSFKHEKDLIESFTNKKLPVFITETGWSKDFVKEEKIADYYKTAFETVWNAEDIVAITPFLLYAGNGPFTQFSFIGDNGKRGKEYESIVSLPKIKGKPILPDPLVISRDKVLGQNNTRVKDFTNNIDNTEYIITSSDIFPIKTALKWLLKL